MRLKWLVLLTVVGVQLAVAGLLVGATWRAASQAVQTHARESMHRLGEAARDRFHRFIAPAEEVSRLLRRLIADGLLERSDRDRLERLLSEPLKVHPAFDAVYYGTSDGSFLYVSRDGDGYLIKDIRRVDGIRQVDFRRRDAGFALVEAWQDAEDDFDPRLRPWFSAATDVDSSQWTSPYVFFTSRRPGVSTATAMVEIDGGSSWGAVAVDIELSAFSSILAEMSSGAEAAFVVDREGVVVALPDHPERWPALFAEDPVSGIRTVSAEGFLDLVAAAQQGGQASGEIDIGGVRHWIDMQGFDNLSPPWLMAVAIPSHALVQWVGDLRDRIVLTTLAMAALAALFMLVAWRHHVERPIETVTARLRRIAEGRPDARGILRGPAEFRDLDAAAAEAGRRIEERERANRGLVATLREYEHAVRQSPVGIAILEPDGRVAFANETYRRTIGPADPLGAPPRLLAGNDDSGTRLAARMEAARAGRTAREDVTAQRADDGAQAVLQCVLAPLLADDGSEGRAILLVEDVTARKRVEQRLAEARNVAERSDRAKSAFLAQMSHELRTPLNAIIGFSEVMRVGVFGPVGSPRYAEYVAHIESSARHLKDLIDRVLDLSRIEQGGLQVSLAEVDPEGPVRRALEMVRPGAEDAGVSLNLEIGGSGPRGPILADAAALRQIVVNLVSNAVKYSARGGVVTTTLASDAGGGIEIVVADQGIGIAAEDLPHVFEPFWQGGSAWESGRVGVGLGLAIVRALVDQHGGRVDMDSAPGKGTRVRVRLPADPRRVLALSG